MAGELDEMSAWVINRRFLNRLVLGRTDSLRIYSAYLNVVSRNIGTVERLVAGLDVRHDNVF